MIDVDKHIAHWREGADEDLKAARDLVERGHVRHGMFFAHLAVEKALKARVCETTNDLAPRVHNLFRLAELASIELTDDQSVLLSDLNRFQSAGRYPEFHGPVPPSEAAFDYIERVVETLEWLTRKS